MGKTYRQNCAKCNRPSCKDCYRSKGKVRNKNTYIRFRTVDFTFQGNSSKS